MNLAYDLRRLLWVAADWLYPPVCAGCGRSGERFCADCLSQVEVIQGSLCAFCGRKIDDGRSVCAQCSTLEVYFDSAASWAVYGGVLREAIHALKYRQNIGLGEYFSSFLISSLRPNNWAFDLVIPVPISHEHLKERSYNQSALLSRPIAANFQVEHSTKALRRNKDTGTQVNRTKFERDELRKDAFSANPAKLKKRKVLLVDDIITTGSTINHCAKALKEAGASQVVAFSIAKTLRKQQVPGELLADDQI